MNENKLKDITTLYKYDTVLSADSVEWCPHAGLQNIFVCANYQLNENEGQDSGPCKRMGRILLFSIDPSEGLHLLQTVDTAAVLDQKWCHCKVNNQVLLGVVNADTTLEIYSLDRDILKIQLVCSYKIQDDKKDTLLLSLDWSTGKYEMTDPQIVCSDSRGNINLFRLVSGKLILENTFHGHQFETWIAGFYYWDVNIFYTGGDDSLFSKFDKRCGTEPVLRNKIHEAGVTSFHSNSRTEYMVASGSYDENVRLWDCRRMKSPMGTIKMPGTLWRLKWDPFYNKYLLATCMLGGVHIIDPSNISSMDIIGSYYEHKNISYGADWCHMEKDEAQKYEGEGGIIIGTCSFYDHLLCVSKFNCDI